VGGVIGPIVVNFVAVVIDVVPITVVFAGAVGGVIGPVAVNFDCLSCGILSDQYTTPPAT
ncbi:unnamed protein product, partial [Rotaria sp. Silwood1]